MTVSNGFCTDPYSAHVKCVQLVGNNKRVLDVGCYNGRVAERLKENGCRVVGIEIDNNLGKLAKRFCERVIIGDVESIELPSDIGMFDVILFADVLEHLKDPLTVLKKLKQYLSNDGYIVVSIPNIANWLIRKKLLFGEFEYTEIGILDKHHLRFFTLKTAQELMVNAGFEIIRIDFTPGLFLPNFNSKIQYKLASLWKSLLAFQFIIKAKKAHR